jgi:hypothetical protein
MGHIDRTQEDGLMVSNAISGTGLFRPLVADFENISGLTWGELSQGRIQVHMSKAPEIISVSKV